VNFASEIRDSKARREAISSEELENAIAVTTDFLKTGWASGGGRRLRQIVWSLWNGWHLINLYELTSTIAARNRATTASVNLPSAFLR
jgi:hypothetical protein